MRACGVCDVGSIPTEGTMKKFLWQLDQIKTKDGITLHGILSNPIHRRQKTAVIVLHGLTGSFCSIKRNTEIARACNSQGFGFMAFNNRGHAIAQYIHDNKPGIHNMGGSGFEKFTDCIHDIDAMISYMQKEGYRRFILPGHSTGANKVAYYLSQPKYQGKIAGAILLGPICDIAGGRKSNPKKFNKEIHTIEKKLAQKKNAVITSWLGPTIMSKNRFKSLYKPFTPEDIFPYHSEKPWRKFRRINMPILLCVGKKDEWLDRPLEKYFEAFRKNVSKSSRLKTVAIASADHSFHGKEKELAKNIVKWINVL